MVGMAFRPYQAQALLSVLALSSRFDGPSGVDQSTQESGSFSTRSVESF